MPRSTPAGPDDTDAARRDREGDYRALVETMDEGFGVFEVLLDDAEQVLDMRCVDVNPAYERQGGRSHAVGRTVREMNPAVEPFWFDIYGRVALTGEPIRFTERSAARDMWFDIYAFRIGAPERRRIGLLFKNVTDQKRTEAALHEKEERQEFLLQLSDTLRPLVDPAAVQAQAGRLLGEHLGATGALYATVDRRPDSHYYVVVDDYHAPGRPSLAGRYRADDFGADLFEELRRGRSVVVTDVRGDARLAESERAAFEALGVRAFALTPLIKGGHHVALFAVHTAEPREWDARALALVAETAERTWSAVEQAKAEQAFRASDERLQLALDAGDMGTFVWDAQRDHADCDARMLSLFGLPADGRLNLAVALGALIHPDDRDRYAGAVQQAIAPDGPGTLREDIRVIHPDGSLHWVTVTAKVVYDGGRPPAPRLVGMAADITERKVVEEALRRSEERLLETDRRKDEFLAVLAHELRNPLAPIRTGLELIRLDSDNRETVERVRRMMERQIGHVVRLVDDLLDVSRITSGKIQLQRNLSPLASLVQGAVEANRDGLRDAGIELALDLPDMSVWLDVDPTRFVQVLSNILHNAIKFTAAGGTVRVAARLEGTPERRRTLELSIADSGIGIDAGMLPRVFDLFAQGDAPADRAQSGLGIGLALARRLMDLHGGTIEAHSDGPGRGSRFTIRVPVAPDPAAGAGGTARPRAAISSRVLVIDDNMDAADTTAMLVEALGGTIAVAYDGASGVERALTFHPHVVLLDLGMPGIDGYETCRQLRRAQGPRLFVVALTGWGQDQDKDQALEAGFDAHLTKPADPAELEQLLVAVEARVAAP